MRVLMIAACPFPWPRGTPIRIQRLAEALVGEGVSVDVATYHLGQQNDALPFQVHRIPAVFYYQRVSPGPSLTKMLVLDPMLLRAVIRLARKGNYDIIHAHHIEGVVIALAARLLGLNLPIVYDAHTLVGSELPDYGVRVATGLKRLIGNFLDYRVALRADSVIAVTDAIKMAFEASGTRGKKASYVIPNGIENSFIRSANRARLNMQAAGPAANTCKEINQAPVFLFAGNTAAYQGIDLMLKAFALVLQRLPNARLWVATHESFSEYQGLVRALGVDGRLSLKSAGLDELPRMLAQADVLLNPRTRCAGIPQKLLNYMASGRPIVTFADSAKIVSHRVEALVVDNGDIQGFADAMLELIYDPLLAEALSMAALDLVTTRYSWAKAAKQTQAVYSDTLANYAKR